MQPLEILEFPDPRLRTVAKPVREVNGELVGIADRMLGTMYRAPGIGLAATQVNFHKRMIVLDVSEDKSRPLVLINPDIIAQKGQIETREGCLSVPGMYESVFRYAEIELEAIGRDGETFTMGADGMLAVCIQHEMDHLEGRLFVDYLSATKRQLIRKKLRKQQKQRA